MSAQWENGGRSDGKKNTSQVQRTKCWLAVREGEVLSIIIPGHQNLTVRHVRPWNTRGAFFSRENDVDQLKHCISVIPRAFGHKLQLSTMI